MVFRADRRLERAVINRNKPAFLGSRGVTNRRLAQSVPSRTSRSPSVRPMACVGTKTHFDRVGNVRQRVFSWSTKGSTGLDEVQLREHDSTAGVGCSRNSSPIAVSLSRRARARLTSPTDLGTGRQHGSAKPWHSGVFIGLEREGQYAGELIFGLWTPSVWRLSAISVSFAGELGPLAGAVWIVHESITGNSEDGLLKAAGSAAFQTLAQLDQAPLASIHAERVTNSALAHPERRSEQPTSTWTALDASAAPSRDAPATRD